MPYKPFLHICEVCHKEFTVPRKLKFCSYKCSSLSPKGKTIRSENMKKLNTNPIIKAKAIEESRKSTSGKNHWQWKGGKRTDDKGYILIRINGKYFKEHRLVMEKYIGRKLLSIEE